MRYDKKKNEYLKRISRGKKFTINGSKFIKKSETVKFLESVIKSKDRVCLEGNNQKQADYLAKKFVKIDPNKIHDLHMVQSSLVLPEHIELFEKGIAKKLDFAFSGPQSKALYKIVKEKKVEIGAIHTYLELFGRYFIDLYPNVSLIAADYADEKGNLYTGFNTEETPIITEATKFNQGIVIAQVKKKVNKLQRVDIPGDWVDFIIETGKDCYVKPLFTRDPANITNKQVLMAMMVLKGIYKKYGVKTLNHGIGYPTAAIELILPTYGQEIGIKGKCCTHWALNPHPTMIPAIEAGFVEHIYSFGNEPGMEEYIKARGDIFSMGPDGTMRSSRSNAHTAGLYAIDLFIGATLQIDRYGNSSTAIKGMIAGFGGAPNLGSTPPGRRHYTKTFKMAGHKENDIIYGRKLVVQITPTVSEKKGIPVFKKELDAMELYKEGFFNAPPIMISGDQVTHIVTEKGIAYLDKCRDIESRMAAVAAIAGDTDVGRSISKKEIAKLREEKKVQTPEDLGIDKKRANNKLLAARSIKELEKLSGGLYKCPIL
ncbi:malonate decarboxylase subunit alpha [bacterium]|nr:malonate decarboxylase subunit alpha [bacterium]